MSIFIYLLNIHSSRATFLAFAGTLIYPGCSDRDSCIAGLHPLTIGNEAKNATSDEKQRKKVSVLLQVQDPSRLDVWRSQLVLAELCSMLSDLQGLCTRSGPSSENMYFPLIAAASASNKGMQG